MIQQFNNTTGEHGFVTGEPIIEPDYSQAADTDSFSVRLPNGHLLCIEYNTNEQQKGDVHGVDYGAHVFILSSGAMNIDEKLL